MPNKTFIVAGMHRSATSLVAKCLHQGGVHMGDELLSGCSDNPEGHFEDVGFLNLNRLLLNKEWRHPNAPVRSGEPFDGMVEDLIRARNIRPLWGWKDPRNCLTIQKYYPLLDDPIVVALFRKPWHVGESLERRGDMGAGEGEALARGYNRQLLNWLTDTFV